ncbi:MAG TPA: hypothetical protein VK210_08605 [Terriglobia bacterium]|nr:hypothetical protein [Terriglobia bacterium]
MGWLNIAANFLREAMNSDEPSAPAQETVQLPADLSSIVGALNQHRAETERNFQAVAQMFQAQNDKLLHTLQIQRRWNYGLTAALVIVAIFVIAVYVRG